MLSANTSIAAQRYVSDQLFTYMHSGPSSQFRIIGSVNAGAIISLIQNSNSGYSKVTDSKGRSGWIETKFITKTMPASLRLPQVEKELLNVQNQLNSIGAKNKASLDSQQQSLSKQIKTNNLLITQRQELLNKIKSLQLDNSKLQTRISNQSEEVERQWFIKGAGVIIAGIFIGLVVPHLPRRKKKNDHWS
jgi:SH3 domain protein